MNTYTVKLTRVISLTSEAKVEAPDEEVAEEKAYDILLSLRDAQMESDQDVEEGVEVVSVKYH